MFRLITLIFKLSKKYSSQHSTARIDLLLFYPLVTQSHIIWMVPCRLSTDAQIVNKLSVETLFEMSSWMR